MTTATISPPSIAIPMLDRATLPVEIQAAEESGKVWFKQTGQLPILGAIKNLWEFTAAPDGGRAELRMHFQATTEDGRQFRLFQDLLDGKWYREFAPSTPGQLLQ